jgi:hypothetical protein
MAMRREIATLRGSPRRLVHLLAPADRVALALWRPDSVA